MSGVAADYQGLIEKRYAAALTVEDGAQPRRTATPIWLLRCIWRWASKNYGSAPKSAPMRFLLRLSGGQTNRKTGLEKLRITAAKGRYLAPFARLLLAVAALRDQNTAQARQILEELAYEFPQNKLYRSELARLR